MRLKFECHMFCEQIGIINTPPEALPESTSNSCSDLSYCESYISVNKTTYSETNDETSSRRDEQISLNQGSLTLQEALLKACAQADDVYQIDLTKYVEKSNRLYWIHQLLSAQAQEDSMQNSVFWKKKSNRNFWIHQILSNQAHEDLKQNSAFWKEKTDRHYWINMGLSTQVIENTIHNSVFKKERSNRFYCAHRLIDYSKQNKKFWKFWKYWEDHENYYLENQEGIFSKLKKIFLK